MKTILALICFSFTLLSYAKKVEPVFWFQSIEMFAGTIQIDVPENFEVLPDDQIGKFYSGEGKPKLVYTNNEKSIRIAFDSKSLNSDERALPVITRVVQSALKKLHPKAKWKNEGVQEINGHNVGYVEYHNKKPEKFYELIFFASFRGQMLSCTFHAPKKGYKPWKEVSYLIMESLNLIDKKD